VCYCFCHVVNFDHVLQLGISHITFSSHYWLLCCILLTYRYTAPGGETAPSSVYAILLDWPSSNSVLLGALASYHVSSVEMLGLSGTVNSSFYWIGNGSFEYTPCMSVCHILSKDWIMCGLVLRLSLCAWMIMEHTCLVIIWLDYVWNY